MKRTAFLVYGVTCHLLFLATFVRLGVFVGNLMGPKTIDAPVNVHPAVAALIDVCLIALLGLQHSVMARPAFKRQWTRLVPRPVERSTYVLVSCLLTWLLMWLWQPIDSVVWHASSRPGQALLWGLFAAGWLMVPAVSLMINHFDLFGTRQVWLYFKRQNYTPLPFRVPLLYNYVRHPLYIGWALAFWATPTMTLGHLLFAGALTAYMVVAAIIEERDLVAHFGSKYTQYQQRVPMFVPQLPFGNRADSMNERD